jgi:D-3-phosphoglycerate dehydrogenase / 2-oxoglutarate reductase
MGMNVIAYDPYANHALCSAASVTLHPSLDTIIETADFFTIHTPLIASTRGMIGAPELAKMKPTACILNVARGGMIDEVALLEALEKGTIGSAGIDVFTSEPPQEGSSAARLIAHPKVVATPHLGASTKEAQENVSIDVCEQVLAILSGALPRSAVNAPIVLPEEYKTLFPFVELVEKMGTLYTQHYTRSLNKTFRTTFELSYEGQLANLTNTKPLFAALVKGLLASISDNEQNVNIVNAELVAKDRGLFISESRSREVLESDRGYSSFVTLRARAALPSRSNSPAAPRAQTGSNAAAAGGVTGAGQAPAQSSTLQVPRSGEVEGDQVIAGYVSGNKPRISRLDRFSTNFVARGNLLICRNFDSCGKIGFVGNRLGAQGVNISFMTVAPLDQDVSDVDEGKTTEALMILGVDKLVDDAVRQGLIGEEGVLECTAVTL